MQPTPVNRARYRIWLFVSVCLASLMLPQLAAAASKNKIDVCHLPPGNPDNFHTINISPSALPAHLGHGDIEGLCENACASLCNDDNACTIDACTEGTLICIAEADKETVNCDDGNPATFDFCDAGAGGCENVPRVTAESQSVSTTGTNPLLITLRGNSIEGESLTFSVGTPSAGALGPVTPVTADGVCSVTTTQTCNPDDPNLPPCPTGESCVLPPVNSATVTYTPNMADTEDSFDFTAALASGISANATVTINPVDPSPPPDDPVATVVAFDVFAETQSETPTVVKLKGEAPEDISLTFSIVSDPTSGLLSNLTQGSGVPQRTAAVTYTPNLGFTGTDSFDFQACNSDNLIECDTGTATVETAPLRPLVTDQTITTQAGLPVTINIGKVQALVLRGAQIAGNVADENGDGLGDNHNNLPGPAPVLMVAGVNLTGGSGSNGVVRMQIEWDISSLQNIGDQLVSARVILNTLKGTVDSEDTEFFVANPEAMNEDGLLTEDDFQTPLLTETLPTGERVFVVVGTMPVPNVGTGVEGIFEFDVLNELQAFLGQGRTFFTVQGRLANEFPTLCSITKTICTEDGQCPLGESCSAFSRRGLQVRTTADGNLTAGLEPQLEITTAGELGMAIYSIAVLPTNGILVDSQGNPVKVGAPLPSTTLTYVPNAGFSGPDTFTTQADNGAGIQTGLIQINVVQTCVEVGRDPNCVPGGGGGSP